MHEAAELTLTAVKRQLVLQGPPPPADTVEGIIAGYSEFLAADRRVGRARRHERILKTLVVFLRMIHPKVRLLRDTNGGTTWD
ncbi:MAG: hypothetical protein IMZ55_09620 [Acidobacteria bacterium]|nr:hypothetical protein [Acidobacteriota bacterium]